MVGRNAAASNKEVPSEGDPLPIEGCRNEIDDEIARELKSTVNELVANEMVTIVEERLYDVLCKMLPIKQSEVRSVLYEVVEHIRLDLCRKQVIGKRLDSSIAKEFHTNAAAEGLSKRLLPSNAYMVPMATCVRRTTDTTMENQRYCVPYASKDLMHNLERLAMEVNHWQSARNVGVKNQP